MQRYCRDVSDYSVVCVCVHVTVWVGVIVKERLCLSNTHTHTHTLLSAFLLLAGCISYDACGEIKLSGGGWSRMVVQSGRHRAAAAAAAAVCVDSY